MKIKKEVTENKDEFMERCMSDDVMKRDFPKATVRFAVCSIEANQTEVKTV